MTTAAALGGGSGREREGAGESALTSCRSLHYGRADVLLIRVTYHAIALLSALSSARLYALRASRAHRVRVPTTIIARYHYHYRYRCSAIALCWIAYVSHLFPLAITDEQGWRNMTTLADRAESELSYTTSFLTTPNRYQYAEDRASMVSRKSYMSGANWGHLPFYED